MGQYGNGLNKRVLFTIANECPSLEYLDINDEKNILFPILHKFCNLKKLSVIVHDAEICSCKNERLFENIAESCKFLESIKIKFRCLEYLDIDMDDVYNDEKDIKVSAISRFSSLKLNKVQLIPEFGAYFYKEDFVELFTKNSWDHLTNLHINSRSCNHMQMKNLLKGISENCPNLENLRIDDLNESNVLYLIKNCKNLQSLGSLNHKNFSLEFLLEIRQRIANLYLSELEGPITPLTSPFHIEKLFLRRREKTLKIGGCRECNREYHYLWALPSDDIEDYPVFDYPRTVPEDTQQSLNCHTAETIWNFEFN